MLQTVKKNLAKLSNYPRLRIFLIVIAIIIVFVIVLNLLTPSANKQAPPSQVQAVGTQGGTQSPAQNADQTAQYQQLVSSTQATNEQKAIASGGSVFQTGGSTPPGTGNTQVSPQQFAQDQTQTKQPPQSSQNTALTQQLQDLQKQLNQQSSQNQQNQQDQAQFAQQQQARQQAMNAQLQTAQNSMRSGIQNISDSWKLPTLATTEGEAPATTGSGGGSAANQPPVSIKAGSILFGVIDTALDSDSPGTPVLATIVTGPYKGAKLIGAFSATKNALVIQFNLMTLPQGASSFGINAYAIDANTANNAVASNVNNHYLLRYGMLFASGFLQGFGNAYQNYTYCPPGTQNCSVINTNGTSNLPNNNVTATTAMYQGFGQIGTSLGQVAAQQFNTPPTITVNQGTGIGVLFMSDLRIPIN